MGLHVQYAERACSNWNARRLHVAQDSQSDIFVVVRANASPWKPYMIVRMYWARSLIKAIRKS